VGGVGNCLSPGGHRTVRSSTPGDGQGAGGRSGSQTTRRPLRSYDTEYDIGAPVEPTTADADRWAVLVDGPASTNPLGRYSFGPGSDLVTDDDGGFSIHLGPEEPTDGPSSNWLPTPTTGEFTVVLRLYLPTDDIWDGTWSPPAMLR
jgi:hypothetical protein